MELSGRVAVVTGAGSGIGRAAALRLAREGARIVAVSRTEDEIAALLDEVREAGGEGLCVPADVSRDEDMAKVFETAAERCGGVDIVFANAGVNGVWAPIHELTPKEWDQTIAVNLRGTFLTLRHAVPQLIARGGGSIVVTSSINGTRTFTSAGASAYATSKAGQVALAKMAALELARHRIRVNVVCPGAIESDIEDNTERRNAEAAEVRADYPDGEVPLTGGAPGSAEDVAELVLFLASDRSRHITGTPVWIDGAQSLLV